MSVAQAKVFLEDLKNFLLPFGWTLVDGEEYPLPVGTVETEKAYGVYFPADLIRKLTSAGNPPRFYKNGTVRYIAYYDALFVKDFPSVSTGETRKGPTQPGSVTLIPSTPPTMGVGAPANFRNWLPLIIGGVAVVGVIAYFATRGK